MSRKDRIRFLTVLVLLIVGAVAVTAWRAAVYVSDASSAQAFRTAPTCASASASAAGPDCVLNVPVVVERAWSESTGGRHPRESYYVELSGSAPAGGTFQLTSSYYLPTGVAGITDALVWRGRFIELLDIGQEFDSPYAPGILSGRDLDWLVVSAAWALVFVVITLTMVTRLQRKRWRRALTMASVVAAFSLTFAAGASQDGSGYNHGGVIAGAIFFVCCGCLGAPVMLALWTRRRRRA